MVRRILTTTVVASSVLLMIFALVVRQPTFGTLRFASTHRAQPGLLGQHVAFLTTEVVPRSADRTQNLDRAAAYIADHFLEMIGYYAKEQAWPSPVYELIYPAEGDFIAVAGGWDDRKVVRHVKKAFLGAGGIPTVSIAVPHALIDASDQRNYWNHGWRAVMVTDTAFLRNPNYHTVRDTASTLDYNRMARVVDGVLNAILHL